MAKRSIALSARGMRVKKSAKSIPDKDIDFSDIPELTDAQLKKMKRVGRPTLGNLPRHLIAIRLDLEVLRKVRRAAKKRGTGYQTLINEILIEYFRKHAA